MTKKKIVFAGILVCFLYVMLEGISIVGLYMLSIWRDVSYEPAQLSLSQEQREILRKRIEEFRKAGHIGSQHPILGWSARKNYSSSDGMYTYNSQNIRARREFSLDLKSNVFRIAAFGDSFTLGAEVADSDTWEEQLSQINPSLEVLNFGVGGYGLGQAYLRYLHEGRRFSSDIVAIGFMSENIFRNVNVFRPFYNKAYFRNLLGKPRFLLRDGSLVLQENILQDVEDFQRLLDQDSVVLAELGENDYHFQQKYYVGRFDFLPSVRLGKILTNHFLKSLNDPILTREKNYNVQSEAFQVTEKIFDKFYRAALGQGALPVIFIYPDKPDLRRFPQKKTVRYQPLLDRFEDKGYNYIDLMTAFSQQNSQINVDELTVGHWGHYSAAGNRIVAEYVLSYLERKGLDSRKSIQKVIREEQERLGVDKMSGSGNT